MCPLVTCREPLCGEAAHYRGYCQKHAQTNDRQINRAGRHVYFTAKWRHTRSRVLFEQPLCECGRINEHVHHIVDLADGGDPWAPENLQGICAVCHGKLTRAA